MSATLYDNSNLSHIQGIIGAPGGGNGQFFMTIESDFRELQACLARAKELGDRIAAASFTGKQRPIKPTKSLSKSEPITGAHLAQLPEVLDISIARTQCLLGLSTKAWYEFVERLNEPLDNRPLARHIRILYAYPSIVPERTDPEKLRGLLTQRLGDSVNATKLSLMLGLERTAMSRWKLSSRGGPQESVQCLIDTLSLMCEKLPTDAIKIFSEFED